MSQRRLKVPSPAAAVEKFCRAKTIGSDEVRLYVSLARGNTTSISKVGGLDGGVGVGIVDSAVNVVSAVVVVVFAKIE